MLTPLLSLYSATMLLYDTSPKIISLTWSLFRFNASTVDPLCLKLFLKILVESCGLGTF